MASKLLGLWRHSLQKYPVLTNTAVYASFYTAAELSQQTFQKYNSPDKKELDFKAVARIVAVGSCVYAPTLFYWYKFLDKKFAGKATKAVLTKVAADQALMTPVLLAVFYSLMGYLENPKNMFKELEDKYAKTLLFNQFFWIPGQTINFYFVPSHLRVVFVATASFIWINVLVFIKRQKVNNDEKLVPLAKAD